MQEKPENSSSNADGWGMGSDSDELLSFKEHPDILVRKYIVNQVGLWENKEKATQVLKEFLEDKSWDVRRQAVLVSGDMGDDEEIFKMLFQAIMDTHHEVSSSARSILEEKAPRNWKAFSKYKNHPIGQIQRAVIRIMANAPPDYIPVLVDEYASIEPKTQTLIKESIVAIVKNYAGGKEADRAKGNLHISQWSKQDTIAIESLMNMLKNDRKSPVFVVSTLLLLGELAIRPIVELYREKDPDIIRAIVKSLEKFDSSWREKFSQRALAGDDMELSAGIIDLMAEIGDEQSELFLERCMLSDNHQLRDKATTHLKERGINREKLSELLIDSRATIRKMGVELVGKMDLLPEEKLKLLESRVGDPSEEVRYALAENLACIGSLALPGIKRLLNDPTEKVRDKIIGVLSNMNDSGAMKILTQELDNENIRSQVIKVLGKKYREQYLLDFDKMSPEARASAGKAIRKINDEDMVKAAAEDLESLDSDSRLKSAQMLTAIVEPGDTKVTGYLLKCVGDPDNRIRSTVAMALGKSGTDQAFSGLVILLRDPNRRVRANTIEALIRFKNREKVIDNLRPFLNDHDNRIKTNAIIAIYSLGDKSVLSLLEAMLRADSAQKSSALYALGDIGDVNTFDIVAAFLRDKSNDVRRNAVKALDNIDKKRAFHLIKTLVYDPEPEIRAIVRKIIERKATEDAKL